MIRSGEMAGYRILFTVGKVSIEGVELVQGYRAELGVLIKYYWL